MSVAAILGAGSLGAAVAQALAARARFRDVHIIDEREEVAAGKALDLRQSGAIGGVDTRLSASGDLLAAAGASVIIVADAVGGGEWRGEVGLAAIRRLVAAGTTAPFVFAGAAQTSLMERVAAELGVPGDRLVGTAGSALVGAARALAALEVDGSAVDVELVVAGRPPAVVVGWSSATVAGSLLTGRVPPHRLLAISQALHRLWPPGPQAIGAATARVAEGLAFGARRLQHAATILDGEYGARGVAAMLPLDLGDGRVRRRHLPSLSPQEEVTMGTGLFSTDPRTRK
jgi:malate dehydrogenase